MVSFFRSATVGCNALAGLATPLAAPVVVLLAWPSLVSIVWGNLAAMRQDNFRRMIAYSSIAHAGYLFYALLGDGPGRFEAVLFYALAHAHQLVQRKQEGNIIRSSIVGPLGNMMSTEYQCIAAQTIDQRRKRLVGDNCPTCFFHTRQPTALQLLGIR